MDKILIKNGHVFSPSNGIDEKLDILIVGDRIGKIGKNISDNEAKVIDASGLTIFPGFIDLHAHLREPGFEYKEDITSGSKAAVAGGYTTVLAMPNTNPPIDSPEAVEYILKRSDEVGLARILPIGTITKGRAGEELADLRLMAEFGAVAFSDDGDWVANSSVMRRALEYVPDFPIVSHAEDKTLSLKGVMNESPLSYKLGIKGIPSEAEEIAIARDVLLAKLTNGRLHIAHVSSRGSVEIVAQAKSKNLRVTAEVTPHHLLFTEEELKTYDPIFKVNPPLRTEVDRKALIEALKDGIIDCIATDHAPHASFEKEFDLNQAPFGILELEVAFSSLYTHLVLKNELDLATLVMAMTYKPAKIFGFERMGEIREGYLADLSIWNLNEKWTVKDLKSKSKNTPFWGKELQGKIKYTIVGGKFIDVDDL